MCVSIAFESASSAPVQRPSRPGVVHILLADDHELVRSGLRLVLEWVPGWKVCAEGKDGAEAVVLARTHRPHVAVVDLDMPVLHGLDAIRAIRQLSPSTDIVALTADDRPGMAERSRLAGAGRFVLKTSSTAEITRAIQSLVDERNRAPGEHPIGGEAAKLTARELDVVRLLALGKSNADAARMLGIARATIETHRQNIMRKLDAESIVEVVRFAIREEIVRL